MKKCYTVRCHDGWHDGFESKDEAEGFAKSHAKGFYEILSYLVQEERSTIKPPPSAVAPSV